MKNSKSVLYIVSTPIGNLDDITLRSLNVLKNSDIILCEDTRRTLKICNHYGIQKKLMSYHKFNERKELNKILNFLKKGMKICLVSDAGTPLISDPGNLLINECIKSNISLVPIPGASSITAAFSVSGFEDKFLFYGFLPKTKFQIDKVLSTLKDLKFALIFFIPGLKINNYLLSFKKYFKNRNILIAREITKIHETFYRGEISNIDLFKESLKGEITVVISKKVTNDEASDSQIKNMAKTLLEKNSLKDTVNEISKNEKISKNRIYKICLELKK